MTVKIAPGARRQFLNASGVPYSGAKLFYYAAGSTTKQNTYTTSAGNVANSNPIILDSSGRTPYGVWLTAGLTYKEVLAPSTDTDPPGSPIYTEDNLSGVNDTSVTVTQWTASSLTPTYVSSTSFTVPGDQTSALHVGRRLQFSVSAGTVYGRISATAYTTLTTVTMVMDSAQNLDSGLSSFNWSILTATNHAIPKLADADWQGINVLPLGGGTVSGALTVSGAATLSSTLGVTGAATLSSTLGVTGATTLSSNLGVTGAITPSQTNGIVGTTTNNDANAGSIGEFVSSTVVSGSAISLTTATDKNVTSISLTAGDWDVDGTVMFLAGSATGVTALFGSSSNVANTSSTIVFTSRYAAFNPVGDIGFAVPLRRVSLGATTTIYLVARGDFSGGTMSAYGNIYARRVR